MFRQIPARGAADLRLLAASRQRQPKFRCRKQWLRAFRGRFDWLYFGLGLDDPVIILRHGHHLQRTVDSAPRRLVEGDFRHLVRNDVKQPLLAVDREIAAFIDLHGIGAWRIHGASGRGGRLCCRLRLRTGCSLPRLCLLILQGNRTLCATLHGQEVHRLSAFATGHSNGQLRILRHHDLVLRRRLVAGQEDRGATGIGRRRQPRIDTQIRVGLGGRSRRTDDVCNRAATIRIGIGKGHEDQKRWNGAQRIAVMACDIRLRQSGIQIRNPLRHADLVFFPERPGEGGIKGRFIFLHAHGLVRQVIALFQQPVGLCGGRPAKARERQKRCQECKNEDEEDGPACNVWHKPEQAKPRDGQRESQNGKRGEKLGRQPLEEENEPRKEALGCDSARQGRMRFKGALAGKAHAVRLLKLAASTGD